jgi:hypothetical protein
MKYSDRHLLLAIVWAGVILLSLIVGRLKLGTLEGFFLSVALGGLFGLGICWYIFFGSRGS